jgi:hypothetical protein
MALEKQISIDKIEVVENGIIQVRQITRIIENGVELSNSFHRWSLTPNQDVSDQEDRVKAIANATWTPEVIAAYQAQLEANLLKLGAV